MMKTILGIGQSFEELHERTRRAAVLVRFGGSGLFT